MGFSVIDIVDRRHDDALVFHQVDGVVFPHCWAGVGGGALLLPCGFQFLQHADYSRLLVRLEDIVKRLQLEGLHGVLFPGGDENNKRLMGKLIDVLRQQYAVQRRDIDIQENGVDPVMLQKLQHVQTIIKGAHNLHPAVGFDKPA